MGRTPPTRINFSNPHGEGPAKLPVRRRARRSRVETDDDARDRGSAGADDRWWPLRRSSTANARREMRDDCTLRTVRLHYPWVACPPAVTSVRHGSCRPMRDVLRSWAGAVHHSTRVRRRGGHMPVGHHSTRRASSSDPSRSRAQPLAFAPAPRRDLRASIRRRHPLRVRIVVGSEPSTRTT